MGLRIASRSPSQRHPHSSSPFPLSAGSRLFHMFFAASLSGRGMVTRGALPNIESTTAPYHARVSSSADNVSHISDRCDRKCKGPSPFGVSQISTLQSGIDSNPILPNALCTRIQQLQDICQRRFPALGMRRIPHPVPLHSGCTIYY